MKGLVINFNLLLLILFMGANTSCHAQAFPSTPAGNRAAEIFGLFNNASTISPKEYGRQNFSNSFKSAIPEDSWGGGIIQIRNMTGKVELESFEEDGKYNITFIIKSISNGRRFSINITTEEKEPFLISLLGLFPAGQVRSEVQNQDKQSVKKDLEVSSEKLSEVVEYLRDQAGKGLFSGAVMVAKDGKPLVSEVAGYANKGLRVPNKIDTKFNLGSLNKIFTSVAILQLVEAGKIGIDDPIGKYLDMFPKEIAENVTIRQLLNMSNGWGDYWQNEYYLANKDMLRTLPDYIEFIKDIPLQFEPGSNTIHSNTGFEVAGAVIEKVSGMDYFTYVREKIYMPAGMINSDSYDRDSSVENLATGYTNFHPLDVKREGWQWANTYILSPRGTPAGGGYSTVGDMLIFDNALRSNKLAGKKYVDFMNNRYEGEIGTKFVPVRVLRGAGGGRGISAFYGRDIINGYTILVLTNLDNPVGIEIGNQIIQIMGLE